MAITINGILCQEIVDQHREGVDLMGGPSARKGYLCAWSDRFTVARGILGLTSATSIGGAVTVHYPASYPEIVTSYAHAIEFEPKGSPTQGAVQLTWPYVIVWVTFARLPFFANSFTQIDPSNPQVFATQKISSSVEYVSIPKRSAKFLTSGKSTNTDVAVRLGLAEIEITFKNIPYMPSPTAFANAGVINTATFLRVGIGKLMFNGITTQETALYDGSYTLDASYSFTARTQRWDYGFDGLNNRWDQIVWSDGSTPFIPSVDFSALLPSYIAV